jgi:sigma-B regulation protein RsbU (phosphoserine phosphatase)
VVSEFKFSSRGQTDPAFVLTNLNNAISSESTGGLFVTLTYVIFDLEAGKLILTNGGHLPLVKASADGQSELIQAEDGMPVGVMEGVAFANFEKPIQSGDCFAFYSDGVSEARNKKKDEYGMETLLAAVTKYRSGTAKEIMDKTVQELNHFMGKADQHDDITLIIAKIEPTA